MSADGPRSVPGSRLPSDLEREIFEITAVARPVCIFQLMLVSWRVKEWIEPILYRTIVMAGATTLDALPKFTITSFARLLQTKPASFYQRSVRHLFIDPVAGDSMDDVKIILTTCSGVTRLFLNSSDMIDLAFSCKNLHPHRLHTHFNLRQRPVDFAHPLFRNITHLEIFDSVPEMSPSGLFLLPHLTHLTFIWRSMLPLFPEILRGCQKLQYLVFLTTVEEEITEAAAECEGMRGDPRFVVMSCFQFERDWRRGALTGDDYWACAEAFVAAKRAGKIDLIEYRIPADASKAV
ncbi:hypothetical protein DFH09DRAFT_1197302 [Mycena vulgaris]|nr:hypothetical protein DFH09DRAFT_1197302 [Mycena vulgaris]